MTSTLFQISQRPEWPNEPDDEPTDASTLSAYVQINNLSRILRASWNKGNEEIFGSGHAGHQCFAKVVSNLIRATTLPPSQWDKNVLNQNLTKGDGFYERIYWDTRNQPDAFPIDDPIEKKSDKISLACLFNLFDFSTK